MSDQNCCENSGNSRSDNISSSVWRKTKIILLAPSVGQFVEVSRDHSVRLMSAYSLEGQPHAVHCICLWPHHNRLLVLHNVLTHTPSRQTDMNTVCARILTSDSASVLPPSVCSLENSASGDTCPTIPSVEEERRDRVRHTKGNRFLQVMCDVQRGCDECVAPPLFKTRVKHNYLGFTDTDYGWLDG